MEEVERGRGGVCVYVILEIVVVSWRRRRRRNREWMCVCVCKGQGDGQAKIAQFNSAGEGEEYVEWINVPVDYICLPNSLDGRGQLVGQARALFQVEGWLGLCVCV